MSEKNQKSSTTFDFVVEKTAKIGENVKIYPNVYILGNSEIGEGTIIYPNTTIENCVIGKNCVIKSSFLEDSVIEDDVCIGPFAHIRPNSVIENGCRVGNFVEVKASHLKKGTKASHLAYIGDSDIGENCNIGCGAIFVNYNGKSKNKTKVGDNCFIGSNCNIIAPVSVADNSYICAGTTLTTDTKSGDFVIGRARETIKPNRASKYLKEIK